VRAKFVDYCRPLKLWRDREPSFFFIFHHLRVQDSRGAILLACNGYYARRRIPTFKDSIERYLELKGNGARRDGTTKYHDNDAEQTCRRG